VKLGFPMRAYGRLLGSCFLFACLSHGLLRGLGKSMQWRDPSILFGPHVMPPELILVIPTLTFAYAIVACGLLWIRQPRGARISWNEHGITEWDGKGVRTAIRWGEVLRSTLSVRVRQKRRGPKYHGGSVEQLADAQGRKITRTMSGWATPIWLYRRRAESSEVNIEGPSQPGKGLLDDGTKRRPKWRIWPLRLGYAFACVCVWGMWEHPRDVEGSAIALLLATLLIGLRQLRPLVELFGLMKIDKTFKGGPEMELVANDGALLLARDGSGQETVFDTSELSHPDGLLYLRRGPAHVVVDPAAAGGAPYREGRPVLTPKAIELSGTRTARRDLQRAVALELVVRLTIPLVTFVPAVILLVAGPEYYY